MGTRRISTAANRERQLRVQALADAEQLFREHGSRAGDLVSDRLVDQSRSSEQRRCDRLTLLEVERLEREQRLGPPSTALAIWKPPLLSWAGIAGLLGIRPRNRGRR